MRCAPFGKVIVERTISEKQLIHVGNSRRIPVANVAELFNGPLPIIKPLLHGKSDIALINGHDGLCKGSMNRACCLEDQYKEDDRIEEIADHGAGVFLRALNLSLPRQMEFTLHYQCQLHFLDTYIYICIYRRQATS
jgi:hypothetical protein